MEIINIAEGAEFDARYLNMTGREIRMIASEALALNDVETDIEFEEFEAKYKDVAMKTISEIAEIADDALEQIAMLAMVGQSCVMTLIAALDSAALQAQIEMLESEGES